MISFFARFGRRGELGGCSADGRATPIVIVIDSGQPLHEPLYMVNATMASQRSGLRLSRIRALRLGVGRCPDGVGDAPLSPHSLIFELPVLMSPVRRRPVSSFLDSCTILARLSVRTCSGRLNHTLTMPVWTPTLVQQLCVRVCQDTIVMYTDVTHDHGVHGISSRTSGECNCNGAPAATPGTPCMYATRQHSARTAWCDETYR